MTIRTREPIEPLIHGDGEHVIAVSYAQLELIAAFLGMVKLGHRPYQTAAMELMDTIEDITQDQDFFALALEAVEPVLEVHDPDSYDIIAQYGPDSVIEFIV